MIPPTPSRILQPELEIPNQGRGHFVQLDERGVAARAGVVAESELEIFIYRLVYVCVCVWGGLVRGVWGGKWDDGKGVQGSSISPFDLRWRNRRASVLGHS